MTDHDLHWLAFRYVAGEMTADEAESFERRLADDQQAREAVEQVVELNEAIRLVATEPLPARRSRVPFVVRRPAACVAALAALLLLSFGLYRLIPTGPERPDDRGNRNPGGGHVADGGSPAGPEVARAWVEVRGRQDRDSLGADAAEPLPSSTADLGTEDLTAAEVCVPQWMLTAFSAREEGK